MQIWIILFTSLQASWIVHSVFILFQIGFFSLKCDQSWSFWNYVFETVWVAKRQSQIHKD